MPKIVDHEKRRTSIAKAAVSVIAEKGLEATKLSDIAKLAGMTTGSITHYFSDKDAVLMAALEMSYETMFDDMERSSSTNDESFSDVIMRVLPITLKTHTAMRVWIAFCSRSLVVSEVSLHQKDSHARWHEQMKQELKRHCERHGKTMPDDADDLCEGITAQINGLIIRGITEEAHWPEARQRKLLKTYLSQIGF